MSNAAADPESYFNHHVFMCTNIRDPGHVRGCCSDKGAMALRDHMKTSCKRLGKRNVRINAAGCLDRCELGPTLVIYPDAVWYRYENESDLDEIIQVHLVEGRRVDRLMLQPTDNFLSDLEKRVDAAS